MTKISYYLFTTDKNLIASNSQDIPEDIPEMIPVADLYGIWVLIRKVGDSILIVQRFDTVKLPGEPRSERGVLVVKLGEFSREYLLAPKMYSEVFNQLRKKGILILEDIPEEISLDAFRKDFELIEKALPRILEAYSTGMHITLKLPSLNSVDYPSLVHRIIAMRIYAKYLYPKGVGGLAYSRRHFSVRDIVWLSSAGISIEEFLSKKTEPEMLYAREDKIQAEKVKKKVKPTETVITPIQRPSIRFPEFKLAFPRINLSKLSSIVSKLRNVFRISTNHTREFAILRREGTKLNIPLESPNFNRTALKKFVGFIPYEPKVLLFQDSEVAWIFIHVEDGYYISLMIEKDTSFKKDPDSVILKVLKRISRISREANIALKELMRVESPQITQEKAKKLWTAWNAVEMNNSMIEDAVSRNLLNMSKPVSFRLPGFKFEHMDILDAAFIVWLYYRKLPYEVPIYGYLKKSPPYPGLWFSDDGKIHLRG